MSSTISRRRGLRPTPTAATGDVTTVRVDAYDPTKKGYGDLQTLNFVVLAGVYLIMAIVATAYVAASEIMPATAAGFSAFSVDGILHRFNVLGSSDLVKAALAAVSSALMDTLAIILLVGGILMLGTTTPTGYKHVMPVADASTNENVYLLSMELLLAVCTLTVISRITRVVQHSGAKLVTVIASVLLIVVVCNMYFNLNELAQLLASIPFAAFLVLEISYVVSRMTNMNMHTDTAYLGLKAIVVVGSLYIASRRYANFQPRIPRTGPRTRSPRTSPSWKATPRLSSAPRARTCNFLHDDMLKSDGDSTITEQWYPWHQASNLTKDETWWCGTDTSGSQTIMARGIIWIPMVIYILVVLLEDPTRLTNLSGRMTSLIKPAGFQSLGVTQRLQKYTRIRIGQGP